MTLLVDWQLEEIVLDQTQDGVPRLIDPFVNDKITDENGVSFGLGAASYDCRLGNEFIMKPTAQGPTIKNELILFPNEFVLATTAEIITLPPYITAVVRDKSTWARRGIALQNTLIDPGFSGRVTLEISNHSKSAVTIPVGAGICQLVFEAHAPARRPYSGKYQGQTTVTGPIGGA
jgi:dCTP deaminase